MANKFLDQNGLLYLWQKITNKFVAKVDGKGLSENDFTNGLKTRLEGIEAGATKTTVVNSLTSDSETDALSARQGKELDKKISSITGNMENLGAGDMLKAVYDTNNNNQVDIADRAEKADDADKLGGQLPSHYATAEEVNKKANDSDLSTVAKSGSYNDLKDKPENFAPTTHNHSIGDVSGLTDALAGKSENGHKHTTSEITDFSTEMEKKADKQHAHEQSEINGLSTTIETVTAIANGKCHTEVFGDEEDMNTWLSNSENKAKLKIGDVFLIRAENVPDYWWDGNSAQILETRKVELDVISNAEIDTIVAT